MSKLFNHNDYVYFALITPIPGSWGFVSYSDGASTYEAIRGINPTTKTPIPFDVTFSTKERVYRCGKNQRVKVIVDGDPEKIKSMLLVDYIKGSPNCENSTNNKDGQPILFKELDEQRDAKLHTDRIRRRTDALNKVLAMKPAQLDEMAPLIGEFSDDPDVKQRALLLFAEQDPDKFFSYVDSEESPIRSLIRKAVQMNKLKKVGESIFWDKEALGGNEDQAVAYLLANKEKYAALKQLVKALK